MFSTTPLPTTTEFTCNEFACFWNHCKGWTLTWLITSGCDFFCGCWALIELIHVYSSIYKLRDSTIENKIDKDNHGTNYILSTSNSKVQLFETRLSQKLFLLIIFIEAMTRSYLFVITPFSFTYCKMTKIDAPNLSYVILADIAPNLFCAAFGCLAFELSKIYYTLTKPREYEIIQRNKSINYSLIFVISLIILLSLQTIIVDIFFILYFNNKSMYHDSLNIFELIDFYSYGAFCLILGLYFMRFTFPIYSIYKQISNKFKEKEFVIVSSIKRTWLMAFYCGLAFILRSIMILAVSDYLESRFYVLGSYQFLFEIIPNLIMMYIYHYSTKNMNRRYANI